MTFLPGGLSNFLRGIGGELEITRVVGGIGGFAYVVGAHAFVAWNLAEGRPFDLTAYCLAFPGGLGVVIGAIAGAASVKDRNVAVAKQTEAKTKHDAAGDLPRAIRQAEGEAADAVADAADAEANKIAGERE